ncbi:YicC/YloC family endoribonuclease [Eubacterium oxidoreducens]|uniref:TIGR00255 family protein n=1 Tax=Eubacterium oxidoreducens TaxID=1732 RepID=A0A1G6AME2_EUBOX|nr:YicC/YloC family endoribonuclease [Eubacterium oxidoreducens]SDB09587.1 TIGR00255 family protein [Eubacterium oxidoreducens]
MIKSMTGFGRGESIDEYRKITVEIKAVNHRYLDLNIKMPKKLNFFENKIRGVLKDYIQRGKVDVYITYEEYLDQTLLIKYNKEVAAHYMEKFEQMAAQFGIVNDVNVAALSRYPDVIVTEEHPENEEQLWLHLQPVLMEATDNFVKSREVEGEQLQTDLALKCDAMYEKVLDIEKRAPQIIEEYKAKLLDKVADLMENNEIDESRIAAEVTIYADKICVDEEIVRLKSHIKATKDALFDSDSVGRKLDFIAQEMNREANTILSKSTDLASSDTAIYLKTEIEKIREQIQNIE